MCLSSGFQNLSFEMNGGLFVKGPVVKNEIKIDVRRLGPLSGCSVDGPKNDRTRLSSCQSLALSTKRTHSCHKRSQSEERSSHHLTSESGPYDI